MHAKLMPRFRPRFDGPTCVGATLRYPSVNNFTMFVAFLISPPVDVVAGLYKELSAMYELTGP